MTRFLLLLISFFFFISCSQDNRQRYEFSGGSLTMALENQPSTFIPRQVMDYYSAAIINQISEGLVAFDPQTLRVGPMIADSWRVSDDKKSYQFKIREDVMFHPHKVFKNKKERLLTVEDIIYSFEIACTPNEDGSAPAAYEMIFKGLLTGAEEFFMKKAESISGLSVQENILTVDLLYEDKNFLNKMANTATFISSKKVIEAGFETDKIGTGPFLFSNFIDDEVPKLILTRNVDYYQNDENGNALPYLDSLIFDFQSRKLEQLRMFENGELDLIIGLPTSRITRMLEGRIKDFNVNGDEPPLLVLENNPLLESQFYYFNMEDERFKSTLVRKAFNYAINKEVIGREILRNQYYEIGKYGIIPPVRNALRGYDFKGVEKVGYTYNPELAQKLLAEAGYPGGEGFGSVNLRYSINDVHSAVADEFSKQIFRVLGINVNIDGSNFEQLNEDGANGDGDIFRLGWAADYPSPESFLMNFYGDFVPESSDMSSHLNKSRYNNFLFDEFIDRAKSSEKKSEQMANFSKAEIELLKDPPIIPLWYSGDIQITESYIRNLHFNALNYFDFRTVYMKKWTIEEYKENYNLAKK